MKLKRILLATDFSDRSRTAYSTAVDMAKRQNATIDLVHAMHFPVNYGFIEYMGVEFTYDMERKRLQRSLGKELLEPIFEGVKVTSHLTDEHGPEAVCQFAESNDSDLIIVAGQGATGLQYYLVGSFAERLVRLSPIPVLTVKGSVSTTAGEEVHFAPKQVLYLHDFSEVSAHAVDYARWMAKAYNSHILVAHVFSGTALPAPLETTKVQFKILNKLEEFADREFSGIPHMSEVLVGDPVAEISELVEKSGTDLICMSTHGWTGLRHVLLGSIAEKIVRNVNCSILTVRPAREKLREKLPELNYATTS